MRARSTNNCTPPNVSAAVGSSVSWLAGTAIGGTGNATSPVARSTLREVTMTRTDRVALRRRERSGTALNSPSKLSSTSSMWRSRSASARRSNGPPLEVSRSPSENAMAVASRPGSRTVSSGTNATPSGKASPTRDAASTARRLLPMPPGPWRVTSRTSGRLSSAVRFCSGSFLPMNVVRACGSGGSRSGGATSSSVNAGHAVTAAVSDVEREPSASCDWRARVRVGVVEAPGFGSPVAVVGTTT